MKKILKVIKGIFIVLWLIVLFFFHISIPAQREFGTEQGVWVSKIAIVIWWIITLIAIAVRIKTDDKKADKKRQLYREQYISTVTIDDPKFGHIEFEHDSNRECLYTLYAQHFTFPKIGNNCPDYLNIHGYNDDTKDRVSQVFRILEKIYADENTILEGCCKTVKECYEDEDIKDENGDPISMEFIKAKFSIGGFDVTIKEDDIEIEITGSMDAHFDDHIEEHGVTASYSSKTGNYDFYSG